MCSCMAAHTYVPLGCHWALVMGIVAYLSNKQKGVIFHSVFIGFNMANKHAAVPRCLPSSEKNPKYSEIQLEKSLVCLSCKCCGN